LLQQIGEGGMGTVWMAEQTEPVRRKVALKLIKPGMDSGNVLARFEAERQALALMDHPNIARILDAGVTGGGPRLSPAAAHSSAGALGGSAKCPPGGDVAAAEDSRAPLMPAGRSYFVMELVKGIPITKFCDEQKLSIRERLELFVPVCQAIQHAHQKGVIHRDIKPSNVLAALYDGQPVPKVIDFGLAKAMGQKLTERTLFTGFGALLGTLEYMSPEQAELNQLDIDTRSDIYSLGVLLYELLTGTTPLKRESLREDALDAVLRRVREEEPPRPSTRLRESRDTVVAVSAQRKLEPAQLLKAVRGDLDWIVMKALEKDRNRRYETANSLALDLKRYLTDETVLARPPSNVYRLRKLARRHKLAFAAAAAVLLTMALGFVGVLWQWRRAEQQRGMAEDRLYVADMNLAYQAAEAGNLGRVQELLQAHRASPREFQSFEWRYLWRLCRGEQDLVLQGHKNRVLAVAFSTDGQTLASQDEDEQCLVFDLATKRPRFALTNINALGGFSPDGKYLTVGGADGAIRRVQTSDGAEVIVLKEAGQLLAVLSDGRTIATSSTNYLLKMWDGESGRSSQELPGVGGKRLPHSVRLGVQVCLSADGKTLAVVDQRGRTDEGITVWDVSAGRVARQLDDPRYINCLLWSADGRLLVAGANNGSVKFWDVSTGSATMTIEAHSAAVNEVAFSADSQTLATASADQTIKLWDTTTGAMRGEFRGHGRPVSTVVFSSDGRRLASGSFDETVRVWSRKQAGNLARNLHLPSLSHKTAVAFSPDSQMVAAACFESHRQLLNLFTGEPLVSAKVWDTTSMETTALLPLVLWVHRFSEDGKTLLTTGGGNMQYWQVATKTLQQAIPIPGLMTNIYAVTCVEAARAGRRGAIGYQNGLLQLFDTPSWQMKAERRVREGYVKDLVFSRDGQWLISGHLNEIQIWDAENLEERASLTAHRRSIEGLAVSPDDRTFASVSFDGTIRLWSLPAGRLLATLTGHLSGVRRVAFSPDGRTLASAGSDFTVKLWNVQLQREIGTLRLLPDDAKGPEERIYTLDFSPDGDLLVCGTTKETFAGGTLRIWRATAVNEAELEKNVP
jgi:WD40 repeat protein/serine/threonine protein kinase